MGSALTKEVRVGPGNTVESQADGMSHTLSVEDVGMCSMVLPCQRKSRGGLGKLRPDRGSRGGPRYHSSEPGCRYKPSLALTDSGG